MANMSNQNNPLELHVNYDKIEDELKNDFWILKDVSTVSLTYPNSLTLIL